MEPWTPPKIAPVASGLGSFLVADLAGQLVEVSAQGEVTVLYAGSLIEQPVALAFQAEDLLILGHQGYLLRLDRDGELYLMQEG